MSENYYQRNLDQLGHNHCNRLSYNQVLDITDAEGSGEGPDMPDTLENVKLFCAIDIDDFDSLIEDILMPAALKRCEDYSNISFSKRTFIVRLNNGNGGSFLPLGPIGDVSCDTHDITTGGTTWKQLLTPHSHDITVTYEGGYDELPANLKAAWMAEVRYMYDNRGQNMEDIGPITKLALAPIRRVW